MQQPHAFLLIYHLLLYIAVSRHVALGHPWIGAFISPKYTQSASLRDPSLLFVLRQNGEPSTNVTILASRGKIIRDSTGIPMVKVRASRTHPMQNLRKFEKSTSSTVKPIKLQGYANPNQRSTFSNMHIMSGSRRGMRIQSPSVFLRPMMGKVRVALFNSLTSLFFFKNKASSVLDLYAGSGSVALEAISRGAGSAVCVDFSEECVAVCNNNAKKAGFDEQMQAVCARVEDFLKEPERFGIAEEDLPFSLVTVTPPYQEVVYSELIDQVIHSKVVGHKTIVVIEYPLEIGYLPPTLDNGTWIGLRNRKYGRTLLATYMHGPIPSKAIEPHPEEFGDIHGKPPTKARKRSKSSKLSNRT